MRGIKINLAAFPGNSQTQILTSPITFFSLLLSLSLQDIARHRRFRSTKSISPSHGWILPRKHEGHIAADLSFSSSRRRTPRSASSRNVDVRVDLARSRKIKKKEKNTPDRKNSLLL